MWRAYIDEPDYKRHLRVALVKNNDDGSESAARPFVVAPIHDLGVPLPTFIDMRNAEGRALLQAIVDECWRAGIKPTGVDDFRRVNDAQGRHLADMRAIVGKIAEVPLP